jgi:glyoxylase-like metal-dependent hydrolase (beta-lactamase superfamily II)
MTARALRIILAPDPGPMTLDGSRTFIVGRHRLAVIDPGPDRAEHLEAVLEAIEGAEAVTILLTHGHGDHSGAALALARRTGAPIRMAAGALHQAPPGDAIEGWLVSGEEVETDAGTVEAIPTPGHAPEHLAFLWRGTEAPPGGALMVGDLLMGQGDTTLVAAPEGDVAAYLESLDRIEALTPGIIHPSHGPPLADPGAAIGRYRRHRLERIEQVERALAEHPGATLDELVRAIYGPELDPRLRGAAGGSVEAMVHFLRRS